MLMGAISLLPCSVSFQRVPGSSLCGFDLVTSHDRDLVITESTFTSHFGLQLTAKSPARKLNGYQADEKVQRFFCRRERAQGSWKPQRQTSFIIFPTCQVSQCLQNFIYVLIILLRLPDTCFPMLIKFFINILIAIQCFMIQLPLFPYVVNLGSLNAFLNESRI